MFAGHLGAALAIGRAERRVNVGVFVTAALLLDLLLWTFILMGWESVIIPTDFGATHQARFDFPWSHGLCAGLGWLALAAVASYAALGRLQQARCRAAALIGVAVMSHWFLDALVHRPELPVAGTSSAKIGLGLWGHLPIAPPPPSARAMAWSSLLTLGAVCALVLWLGRQPGKARA